MEENIVNVPKNIKYYRARLGLSQDQLATRIGSTRSTLSHWEIGDRYPKVKDVIALADIFGIEFADMYKNPLVAPERIDEIQDEVTTLFSKYRDVLTPEDKEYIKFIIEKRLRDLENK